MILMAEKMKETVVYLVFKRTILISRNSPKRFSPISLSLVDFTELLEQTRQGKHSKSRKEV